MPPLAGATAQTLPLPPSDSQGGEIIPTALHETVYISASTSCHLTDIGSHPKRPMDERQITKLTSCFAHTESEEKPEKFQENDVLLVYPCISRGSPNLDLSVNPADMKRRLPRHIRNLFEYHFLKGIRKSDYTEDEINSLVDSILTKLPAELTEFLNRDYHDDKRPSPSEYQALARFHCAIILFEDFECEFRNSMAKDCAEFNDFFIKKCLPLRDGWSEYELELIAEWLNAELEMSQDHPDHEMKHHIKTCHYGALKAGCVSVCGKCEYTVIENREAYKSIKSLESQLAKCLNTANEQEKEVFI
ncbi:hypothetical protein [Salinisphaera sp. G21_0]|uniref:hypothetical protein n=1 Tax=Salinisphaera sp. G21_0 TaxID=2821094 RepID=UPI001ADBB8F5|nr:hypothetical protein [Salinisphaera sp. G21_0]MBO9484397.1 hypothetical protein [Salinisphaera sp. G21_0]